MSDHARDRRKERIAVAVLLVSATAAIGGQALTAARSSLPFDQAVFGLCIVSVQIVGAVLLAKKPENNVARLMAGMGLVLGLFMLADGYGRPDSAARFAPGGVIVTALISHSYLLLFAFLGLLFYLFPTGSVHRPKWRFPMRAMLVGLGVSLFALTVAPGPLIEETPLGPGNPSNPLGLDMDPDVLGALTAMGGVLLLGGAALSLVALIARYRGSYGTERMQMKFFATGAAMFTTIMAVNLILRNFFELPLLIEIMTSVAFMLIPISIGNAILRYRLYEIDLLINQALVYGVLTAIVVAAYLGCVFALQNALEPITRESDLAVAASTLAVAASIRPLRARIQSFIDRRFYRRKYDAAQTLASFGTRLRDEVDIEILHEHIVSLVGSTVQPAHVGLWLKSEATS